jgi:hypothetical protein
MRIARVHGVWRQLDDLLDGVFDQLDVVLDVLVLRREADALVRQVGDEALAVQRGDHGKMPGVEGDVFVFFDGVVHAPLVVELPLDEGLRQFLDLELADHLAVLDQARHAARNLHLLSDPHIDIGHVGPRGHRLLTPAGGASSARAWSVA